MSTKAKAGGKKKTAGDDAKATAAAKAAAAAAAAAAAKAAAVAGDDDDLGAVPDMAQAQRLFEAALGDDVVLPARKEKLWQELVAAATRVNAAPFYTHACEALLRPRDDALHARMAAANAARLDAVAARVADAEQNLGESDVRDALQARADYLCAIGDKAGAEAAYRDVYEKTVGVGGKLDVVFTLVRLGLFWADDELVRRNVDKAKALIDEGGDWDRRNRLKDYEGLYLLRQRDAAAAVPLLLDTLSTFNATELCSFTELVKHTVLAGVLVLERVDIKQKLAESPDVLSVVDGVPHLEALVKSLYDCDYKLFFRSLAHITEMMRRDRTWAPHVRHFCREMRIKAYSQKLYSYRSVQLAAMAADFGVTVEFLDDELSRFIALGRLPCKIDKVGMVIEMSRENARSMQYQQVLKHGDVLINRISKLSRVIQL